MKKILLLRPRGRRRCRRPQWKPPTAGTEQALWAEATDAVTKTRPERRAQDTIQGPWRNW